MTDDLTNSMTNILQAGIASACKAFFPGRVESKRRAAEDEDRRLQLRLVFGVNHVAAESIIVQHPAWRRPAVQAAVLELGKAGVPVGDLPDALVAVEHLNEGWYGPPDRAADVAQFVATVIAAAGMRGQQIRLITTIGNAARRLLQP